MRQRAVLSGLGRDRVGVADDLSTALANRGMQIEDSRMSVLHGQFALMVQVCGEEQDVEKLQQDLSTLAGDIGVQLRLAGIESAQPQQESQLVIEAFSLKPTDLNTITSLLKRNGINIEELTTEATAEPFLERTTFYLRACVTVPPTVSAEQLRDELSGLERERHLEIFLRQVRTVTTA